MVCIEALLNTGSTIDEGRLAKGGSKYTDAYIKECAVCWLNEVDYAALGFPEKVKVIRRDQEQRRDRAGCNYLGFGPGSRQAHS